MDNSGFIVSHLNISGVRVEDGGLYECRASNSKGHSSHSARLNVYGKHFLIWYNISPLCVPNSQQYLF